MTLLRGAYGRILSANVMSHTARVAILGAMLLGGCASSTTTGSGGGGTTPVNNGGSDANDPASGKSKTQQADALVKTKPNFFPPVDVAGWVCEPKSWNEQGVALLHCIGPVDAPELIGALKLVPSVESAEPAK